MPFDLTKQQLNIIKIVVVTGEKFHHWINNATYLDGTPLFGTDRGTGSLYEYCRGTRYKSEKRSFESFIAGSARSTWKPLTKEESNPLLYLKAIAPLRSLTNKEFQLQSIPPTMSRTPPRTRGRSNTPNRPNNSDGKS